jgi:hypothetical protein
MFLQLESWEGGIDRHMATHPLTEYMLLLETFLTNKISASEFEHEYLVLFKGDTAIRPEAEFLILDKLFASVDAFCPDPEICDEDDMNEDQLREECSEALRRLKLNE